MRRRNVAKVKFFFKIGITDTFSTQNSQNMYYTVPFAQILDLKKDLKEIEITLQVLALLKESSNIK